MARYLINLLIALDQVGTTLCGGWPDELMSSYAYRLEQDGKMFGRLFRPLIDAIFFWELSHCFEAWTGERKRNQFPPELR